MQQEVKSTAKSLADALNKMGYRLEGEELSHGHALELISKVLGGVKEWNALSAELSVMPAASEIAKLTSAAESVITSFDNTGCDGCGVIDESVKDNLESAIESIQTSGKFVIVSEKENGFWSNKDGWGDFCLETTVFTAKEKAEFRLPSIGVKDAAWLPLTDADGHFEIGRRYVRREGTRCPFCGSTDISGNEWNADGGWSTQEMGCDNCNAQWQDVYKLETIYVQNEGDEQTGVSDNEIFEIEMHSGAYGSEFFKYDSEEEMLEGLFRLMRKTSELADGIDRNFWRVTGYDQGDVAERGEWLACWDGKEFNGNGTYTKPELVDDQFQCVHCGQVHDNDDSIQTEVGLVCDKCDEKVVRDAITDWQYEVENGDTKLGFEEWMRHRREDAKNDPESCIQCGCDVRFDGFCSDLTCLHSDWPQSLTSLYSDYNSLSEEEFGKRYGSLKKGYKVPSVKVKAESITDIQGKMAEKVYQDWSFPFNVEGDSGWESTAGGQKSSWSKAVFLENKHGDSIRVSLCLEFDGTTITHVSCLNSYGDNCGHGNFEVILNVGDEFLEETFECEASDFEHARLLALSIYQNARIVSTKLK